MTKELKADIKALLLRLRKRKLPPKQIRAELALSERLVLLSIDLLLGAFLTLSLGGMVFALLGLDYDMFTVIPSILIALPLIALLTWGKRNLLITAGLIFLIFIYSLPSLDEFVTWVQIWVNRVAITLEPTQFRYLFPDLSEAQYSILREESMSNLTFGLIFILAILAYILASRFRLPMFTTVLLMSLVVACTYFTRDYANKWSLWGLLTIVPLFFLEASSTVDVQPTRAFRQYLKVALSGLLTALLLLGPAWFMAARIQPRDIYSFSAQGFVDDLSTFLPDELRPTRRFDPFSLNRSGYYPRSDLLGGSVTLNPNPVLRVRGRARGLLKGQTSQRYTGESWERHDDGETWRFGSPVFSSIEEDIFNWDNAYLRDLGIQSLTPESASYHINMLQSGITVLFTIGQADDLSFDSDSGMQAFFNRDGVIYAQYPLTAGQGYSLQGGALPLNLIADRINFLFGSGSSNFNRRFGPDESGRFPTPDGDFDMYLQLPDTAPHQAGGLVYETARMVAQGENPDELPQDSLSQLLRLVDYHKRMEYSLTMPIPPDGQDFVEHVLDVQAGYCVYFATSLTVMARSLGIPSRYVEGFGIPGGAERLMETSGLVITGEQAHAWTEVYLDGLGWVPLDPTPGGVAGGETDIDTPGEAPIISGIPTITISPGAGENPLPQPGDEPGPDDDELGITDLIDWRLIFLLVILVVLASVLMALGFTKRLRHRIQLYRPTWAIRHIGKGQRQTGENAESDSWYFPESRPPRELLLMYWQEIRTELERMESAKLRAERRAKAREKRRMKKMGAEYKTPERDFYKPKVQSVYKASPFVEFLNEEAARKQAREKELAAKRVIYENKPRSTKSLIDRWSDPKLVGTWRREIENAIKALPLLKKEIASSLVEQSLADLLREAERLAERSAFSHPDYKPEAKEIYQMHFLLHRLRYLRRHWPTDD